MAAPFIEVMSFASKFLHLGTCGINATLQFEANNGRVVANFTADLGPVTPPSSFPSAPAMRTKSSPSRLRRRQRRAKTQSMDYDANASSTIDPKVDNTGSSVHDLDTDYGPTEDIEGESFMVDQDQTVEETAFQADESPNYMNNEISDDTTCDIEFLGDSTVDDKMYDHAATNMDKDLALIPTA